MAEISNTILEKIKEESNKFQGLSLEVS